MIAAFHLPRGKKLHQSKINLFENVNQDGTWWFSHPACTFWLSWLPTYFSILFREMGWTYLHSPSGAGIWRSVLNANMVPSGVKTCQQLMFSRDTRCCTEPGPKTLGRNQGWKAFHSHFVCWWIAWYNSHTAAVAIPGEDGKAPKAFETFEAFSMWSP